MYVMSSTQSRSRIEAILPDSQISPCQEIRRLGHLKVTCKLGQAVVHICELLGGGTECCKGCGHVIAY